MFKFIVGVFIEILFRRVFKNIIIDYYMKKEMILGKGKQTFYINLEDSEDVNVFLLCQLNKWTQYFVITV